MKETVRSIIALISLTAIKKKFHSKIFIYIFHADNKFDCSCNGNCYCIENITRAD